MKNFSLGLMCALVFMSAYFISCALPVDQSSAPTIERIVSPVPVAMGADVSSDGTTIGKLIGSTSSSYTVYDTDNDEIIQIYTTGEIAYALGYYESADCSGTPYIPSHSHYHSNYIFTYYNGGVWKSGKLGSSVGSKTLNSYAYKTDGVSDCTDLSGSPTTTTAYAITEIDATERTYTVPLTLEFN